MHALKVILIGLLVLFGVAVLVSMGHPTPHPQKTIGDTCQEQFPDNPTLRLACIERGMDDETAAKIKQAEHDAR